MSCVRRLCAILMVALLAGLPAVALAQNVCAGGAAQVNPRAVAPPVEPGAGGIGGTGVLAGRPGLGGTGIDPGGIGGTGIVGVITGFASICVNGIEVHFDDTTPVSIAGEPAPARQLAVGQSVVVQARGQGDEVAAARIAVLPLAVGPISALDAVAGQLQLLGQTVAVGDRRQLVGLQPGDWVRVSGLRRAQGQIAATRVEAVAVQPLAQLTGVVEQDTDRLTRLSGVSVRIGAALRPAGMAPGRELTVAGHWDGQTLQAQRVVSDPTRQGIVGASRVVLEGYVHAADARRIDLGLGPLMLAPDAQLPAGGVGIDQLVRVSGRIGPDQRITLDRVQLREPGGDGARDPVPPRSRERQSGRRGGDPSTERSGSDDSGRSSGGSDDSGGRSGSNSGSGGRGGGGSGGGRGK